MNPSRWSGARWQLADLLDFEALLAGGERVDERERLIFARDIRPQLAGLPDDRRRALGLRLWLMHCRDRAPDRIWPSWAWSRLIDVLGWLLLGGFALAGAMLAWGLCLGNGQRVHVVIFLGLTVALPWAGFVLFSLARLIGRNAGAPWLIRVLRRPALARLAGDRDLARWAQAFTDSRAARRAATARAGRLLQWGGLGFSLGVVCAFLISLMIFDVRFYWEATPNNTGLMNSAVSTLAAPWAGIWPAAVPGDSDVRASRLSGTAGQQPPGGAVAGAWWRFLVMTVLVWGTLPRLLLIALFAARERWALARLDFQAPRHRALWRALAGVTRGAVAESSADGALVLDVGGHDIDGGAIRGFLLRRLRLNPQATQRVSVLDADAEEAADRALAHSPGHVVLVAPDWALSPRSAERLQARVRATAGRATPITWVIVADDDGTPGAPEAGNMARWTAFVDGLRDPATEITAYDPAA
ncbi:DUF2868 domain-containing protein [Salinisphaera sp. LB1]|uniref:DUF2868 domain-containing protein n=1 Tax=Salinisphaera sp. LB1 TaxID=2183911 RepID=UPI000D707C59|nr:DUF2868 domain-containing protein [Salinisphaera sp. LB1]AWN15967.1 hypothetical protein SALB1_1769 [Salinisphaera sp. LB1]